MALLKSKQPCGDWREHAAYCKARDVHQALVDNLPHLAARRQDGGDLHRARQAAIAARERAELEHLAGRVEASAVSPLVDAELEAKRAYALGVLAHEDAVAAEVKLRAQMEATRKAAKQEAAEVLRERYVQALIGVKQALEAAMAADQALEQALSDIGQQFPYRDKQPDPDGFPAHLGLARAYPSVRGAQEYVNDVAKELARLGVQA